MLTGEVEVDETYIGGRVRGKGHGHIENKTIMVGAKQCGGATRMKVVVVNDRETLHGFIHETVSGEAEAIYTDEWRAYRGIGDANTRHETVNHKAEEWVRGPVHTNGIEGTWSLFNARRSTPTIRFNASTSASTSRDGMATEQPREPVPVP